MSTEQNKQTVREFFEHFCTANVSATLDLLDDAVIWRVMGNEGGLPMSGEMDKEAIPGSMKLTPTG